MALMAPTIPSVNHWGLRSVPSSLLWSLAQQLQMPKATLINIMCMRTWTQTILMVGFKLERKRILIYYLLLTTTLASRCPNLPSYYIINTLASLCLSLLSRHIINTLASLSLSLLSRHNINTLESRFPKSLSYHSTNSPLLSPMAHKTALQTTVGVLSPNA